MGAQLSTVAPTAMVPIDAYIAELGDLSYIADLGRSRFLKTTKAMHRDGVAVVKVFIKPTTTQIEIGSVRNEVKSISETLRIGLGPLNEFSNTMGYSRIIETERAGYLVRQYIKHNLYDRISTRPFLESIEKKWIAYQLLRALKSCHAHGICHGDIKSENVLVGSWKWVYLVDFAPFKPVRLPETDTAQFLFYFDVSQRRACYISPERFSDDGPDDLCSSMDIYSAGCVIAELFLDGQPLFTLADLFKYKRGAYTPNLEAINEQYVRDLIVSMVDVNPKNRLSAEEYLQKFRGTIFPEYFDTFWNLLQPYSGSVGATSSDKMVEHLWNNFEGKVLSVFMKSINQKRNSQIGDLKSALPVVVTLPNSWWIPQRLSVEANLPEMGAVIILSYICSALTSTSTLFWRLRAAKLILVLAEFVSDDVKLDRCLPYLTYLLKDPQTTMKKEALLLVTHLMTLVNSYSALNSKVYTTYLLPRITQAISVNSPPPVKAMYATCLPQLAQCAVDCEGWESIIGFVDDVTRFLLVDKVGIVRRCLLDNADALCAILRKQGTNDIILSHAITYLNDKDPFVRMDLFRFIAKVAPLIGPCSVEQYVLPLLIQSLCDTREDIVAYVIRSISAMVEVGLLRLKTLLGVVVPTCVKFLIHPNIYLRIQTILLLAASAKQLSKAQIYCLLRPLLSPYLNIDISDYKDPNSLIEGCKPPISQSIFSLALNWAMQATNSAFWMPSAPSSTITVTFSQEDRRWLTRLREVGFNNEDLWQLLAFRDYLWQMSLMASPSTSNNCELVPCDSENVAQEVISVCKTENGRCSLKKGLASWNGGPIPEGLEYYVNSSGLSEIQKSNIQTININSKIVSGPIIDPKDALGDTSVEGSNATAVFGRSLGEHRQSPFKAHAPAVLVTSIKAHRGAIQVLSAHENNRLFISGADDGVMKVWDIKLLLKGSSRPVAQVNLNSPITAGAFLGNSYVVAIGTQTNEIKFFSCPFKRNGTSVLFESIKEEASYKLEDGFPLAFHMRSQKSTDAIQHIWVLKSNGTIVELALSNLRINLQLNYPREHGIPISWTWDKSGDWVAVGTSHGVVELFDVRFGLLVNSWGVGDLQPITALELHPTQPLWICVSGGYTRNLISIWDVQKVECRELLVPQSDLDDQSDDDKLPSLNPLPISQPSFGEQFAAWDIKKTFSRAKPSVTSMASSKRNGGHHLLTGGGDKILRYWNLRTSHLTMAISGTNYTRTKLNYMGKVGSSVKFTYETYAPAKTQDRLARTGIIELQDQDISRNHRGSIVRVALMEMNGGRDLTISVDEVGVIKIFSL